MSGCIKVGLILAGVGKTAAGVPGAVLMQSSDLGGCREKCPFCGGIWHPQDEISCPGCGYQPQPQRIHIEDAPAPPQQPPPSPPKLPPPQSDSPGMPPSEPPPPLPGAWPGPPFVGPFDPSKVIGLGLQYHPAGARAAYVASGPGRGSPGTVTSGANLATSGRGGGPILVDPDPGWLFPRGNMATGSRGGGLILVDPDPSWLFPWRTVTSGPGQNTTILFPPSGDGRMEMVGLSLTGR